MGTLWPMAGNCWIFTVKIQGWNSTRGIWCWLWLLFFGLPSTQSNQRLMIEWHPRALLNLDTDWACFEFVFTWLLESIIFIQMIYIVEFQQVSSSKGECAPAAFAFAVFGTSLWEKRWERHVSTLAAVHWQASTFLLVLGNSRIHTIKTLKSVLILYKFHESSTSVCV